MNEICDHQPAMGRARGRHSERLYVFIFANMVMLLTTLPYLIGFSTQGDAFRFTGFVFGVEDGNSYLAKMLSGSAGAWLFRSPYTAFPQQGLFFYFPYLLLGKLAAPPGLHEQLTALFHLYRWTAGVLMLMASYDFLRRYLTQPRLRAVGLGIISLGGGLGWLLPLTGRAEWLGSPPLEMISPEAFGFLSLYGLPHLAAARALLLWALLAYLDLVAAPKSGEQNRRLALVRLGGLWALAGLFNPLTLVIVGVVIVPHFTVLFLRDWKRSGIVGSWQRWRGTLLLLVLAGLPAGIFLTYNLIVTVLDSYARLWNAQNLIRSPHPLHFLLAYGLFIPFAWLGGARLLKKDFSRAWLLVGWALLIPLLVYAPVGLQRRLVEGGWVAVCALGLAAFDLSAAPEKGDKTRSTWSLVVLGLTLPGTAILLAGGFLAVLQPQPPRFRPLDEVRIFISLQQRAAPGAVVLAAYETSNPLPAWAPVRVLAGHGPESIYKDELLPQVSAFFDTGTSDDWRQDFIKRFEIEFLLWGPAERALGGWEPAQSAFLNLIEHQGAYALYRVIRK